MGASACGDLAFPKPAPRVKGKRRKALDAEAHQRKVYAAVDKRDKLRCVVTGRRANPHSVSELERLEHHHILQRGRDRGPTETWNVCSLHVLTHAELHSTNLTIEGNADEREGENKLRIGLKASAVESLFGRRRVPPHIEVIDVENWAAWLDQHAARTTRQWIQKVGRL
jgi:hypothetical protein